MIGSEKLKERIQMGCNKNEESIEKNKLKKRETCMLVQILREKDID